MGLRSPLAKSRGSSFSPSEYRYTNLADKTAPYKYGGMFMAHILHLFILLLIPFNFGGNSSVLEQREPALAASTSSGDLDCPGSPPGPYESYLCVCTASTWYGRRDEILQGFLPGGEASAWSTFQYDHWGASPNVSSGEGWVEDHIEEHGWPVLQFPPHHYNCQWSALVPE